MLALRIGPVENLTLFFGYREPMRVVRASILHHPAEGSRAHCHTTVYKPRSTAGLEDVPGKGYRMDTVTCASCKRRFRIERSTIVYEAGPKATGTFRALLSRRR